MAGLDAICAKLYHNNNNSSSGLELVEQEEETVNSRSVSMDTKIETDQAAAARRNKRKPSAPRCLPLPSLTSDPIDLSRASPNPLDLSSAAGLHSRKSALLGDSPVDFSVDEYGALDLSSAGPANSPKLIATGTTPPLTSSSSGEATSPVQQQALMMPLHLTPGSAVSGSAAAGVLFNPFSLSTAGAPPILPAPFLFGYGGGGGSADQHPTSWMNALSAMRDRCTSSILANQQPLLLEPEVALNIKREESTCLSPVPNAAANLSRASSPEDMKIKDSPGIDKNIEDSGEYIRRFSSYEECGQTMCREYNYRDHFHCLQCDKVLGRREEMIRHFKWHKKREESLQHGFMRYTPNDDCETSACIHNGKQTHYHCLHDKCGKIYISTSDVQMHANFHRKDAVIIQEGFQRFRATEDCGNLDCPYQMERTTHFHCRRFECRYTFKNKADMEKHKSHHQRNDEFAKDGFKKFIKYEECDYPGCKYSKMMNHIHCIQPGCDYVVHSSSQILSHKRKHERRNIVENSNDQFPTNHTSENSHSQVAHNGTPFFTGGQYSDRLGSPSRREMVENDDDESLDSPRGDCSEEMPNGWNDWNRKQREEVRISVLRSVEQREKEVYWQHYFRRYTANDPCLSHCSLLYKDHYHCVVEGCIEVFKTKERVREHTRQHTWDEEISRRAFRQCNEACPATSGAHFHCLWPECSTIVTASDPVFSRSQHYRIHDSLLCSSINGRPVGGAQGALSAYSEDSISGSMPSGTVRSVQGSTGGNNSMSKRRGRPPKYRKDVFVPKLEVSEELYQDDSEVGDLTREMFTEAKDNIFCGFKMHPADAAYCIDDRCHYYGTTEHFHCLRPRCHHATHSLAAVNLHRREFHHYLVIEEGYEFFDRSVDCRRPHCTNNRMSRHYHCVRHNCDYAFIRYNTMHQHTRKHAEMSNVTPSIPSTIPNASLNEDSESSCQVLPESAFWMQHYLQSVHQSVGAIPSLPSDLPREVLEQKQLTPEAIHKIMKCFSNSQSSLQPSSAQEEHSLQSVVDIANAQSETDLPNLYYNFGSCGRPFCKLRKKGHFHCPECEQAFSDIYRIKNHILKHLQRRLSVFDRKKNGQPKQKKIKLEFTEKVDNDEGSTAPTVFDDDAEAREVTYPDSPDSGNLVMDISGPVNSDKLIIDISGSVNSSSAPVTSQPNSYNTDNYAVSLEMDNKTENSPVPMNTDDNNQIMDLTGSTDEEAQTVMPAKSTVETKELELLATETSVMDFAASPTNENAAVEFTTTVPVFATDSDPLKLTMELEVN